MSKKAVLAYKKRLHCYNSSIRICWKLYETNWISFEAYEEIEKRLAKKYKIDEKSLFRIKAKKPNREE